jgi:hypothetical protein
LRLAALGGVASFALWVYAFSPWSRTDPPDYLQDRSWPAAAEPICAGAQERIAALPFASTSATAAERADLVDDASDELDRMLTDLAALPLGSEGSDRVLVDGWIADYRTYVADRRAFTTGLRSDPDTRFVLSMKGSHSITRPLDQVAKNNRMPSCATPTDA